MFDDVIKYAELDSDKTALEIGPGTGQGTEPILKTDCSYLAIELGENFTVAMKNRFGSYDNSQIINADFECHHYYETREYSADEFISWTIIQASNLTLLESNKSEFITGIRDAIFSTKTIV